MGRRRGLGNGRRSLLIFSAVFFLLLMSPFLLSWGMFFDGLTYAAIGRNLAIGFGKMWKPAYSLTLGREFYGHPPLAFWLQALLFKIFGDKLWVDKLYTFAFALLNLSLFWMLWRRMGFERVLGFWAPFFVLSLFYTTTWVMRNNLLENTLSVFTLGSTLLYFIALERPLLSILAGVLVLGAFLVKGPVGLFPLIFPFLYFRRRGVVVGLVGILSFLLGFLVLLSFPEVRHFFTEYFKSQIFKSVMGLENPAPTRLYILYALGREMVVPLGFLIVVAWKTGRWPRLTPAALHFILFSLSATLPLMFSAKQSRFYMFPSLFFWSMALTLLFSNALREVELSNRIKRSVEMISPLLLVLSLGMALKFAGTGLGGYRPFYSTFVENPLKLELESHEYLSVCPKDLYRNWPMFAGMERVFKLSMDLSDGRKFLLIDEGRCSQVPKDYIPLHPRRGGRFRLYRKISP
ncbi:MAG: hypothetical protein GXO39_02595 [Thermotogae bacterium]|nr:hypothetical protein [Thermotogota bacterium]